jgi:hypothetical protein
MEERVKQLEIFLASVLQFLAADPVADKLHSAGWREMARRLDPESPEYTVEHD